MGIEFSEDNYKVMALLRQWEDKLKQQSAVNILNTEDNPKKLLLILSTLQPFCLQLIFVTKPCIHGPAITLSQYTLQKNFKLLSDLIFQLQEQRLVHISIVVYSFMHSVGIGNLVHLYFAAGSLSFDEFSHRWCRNDRE